MTARACAWLLDRAQLALSDRGLAALIEDPLARAAVGQKHEAILFGAEPPPLKNDLFLFMNGIAYIPIRGLLFNDDLISPRAGVSGYKGLSIQLVSAMADPDVRAILFDINSPGGMADGVFDLADEIAQARERKPIWAIANPLAASAAYAIASATGLVFLPRLGRVGSIGVWTLHMSVAGMLADAGIEITLIFAGERKVDGNPFQALSDRARDSIQDSVNRTHALFVETVARKRGLGEDAVRATEADVFEDVDAVAAGLADAVATDKEVAAVLLEELAGAPALTAA